MKKLIFYYRVSLNLSLKKSDSIINNADYFKSVSAKTSLKSINTLSPEDEGLNNLNTNANANFNLNNLKYNDLVLPYIPTRNANMANNKVSNTQQEDIYTGNINSINNSNNTDKFQHLIKNDSYQILCTK